MEGISKTQASLWESFPESCASVATTGPPLTTTVGLAEQRLDKGSDFLDRMTGQSPEPRVSQALLRMRSLSITSIPASACAQLWQIRQGPRLL